MYIDITQYINTVLIVHLRAHVVDVKATIIQTNTQI